MMKLTILAVLAVGLAWGISVVKTDSTNGRRFILERSWELVQARPFAGYGPGGFLREYMPRQADYFKAHADSGHAWLASEVYHPLNEFVWVWIEFGLPGVLLSLGALAWLCPDCSGGATSFPACWLFLCVHASFLPCFPIR